MNKGHPHVLVTGAAGYIGSVLVPDLLRNGYSVTAVDNFSYGQSTLLDCCHIESLTTRPAFQAPCGR